MTEQKQNIIETKMLYDSMQKEIEKLKQEQAELYKMRDRLYWEGYSNNFLFRMIQRLVIRPITFVVKNLLNLPPTERETQLNALDEKTTVLSKRMSSINKQVADISEAESVFNLFDTITKDDIEEYRENVIAREQEINSMRSDAAKHPSCIVQEFSQIKGWDDPINKHKILDFILEKNEFINKFLDEYDKGNIAFEYDGKKYTSTQNDDYRTLYSTEINIKDIEAALSFALGEDVSFDFKKMRYVTKEVEYDISGDCVSAEHVWSPNEKNEMVMKEYGERLSKMIEAIAKEKHSDIFKYKDKDGFEFQKIKFDRKTHIAEDDVFKDAYYNYKDALSVMVAHRSYIESKIATEFNAIKGTKKQKQPKEIMDYVFAKANFIKQHNPIKDAGMSFSIEKDGSYNFKNGTKEKNKVLDINVGIKDIESALTYATQVPVHYDWETRTFKSALFEVDGYGQFIASELMPAREYKELHNFFKEYGEKTTDLLIETAKRDAPSLLYKPIRRSNPNEWKEAIRYETDTLRDTLKKERLEKAKKEMETKEVVEKQIVRIQKTADVAPDINKKPLAYTPDDKPILPFFDEDLDDTINRYQSDISTNTFSYDDRDER